MAPTERLKLRRQMAAAAGKKSTTSSVLSWKHCGLRSGRRALNYGYSDLGRRSLDWKLDERENLDEADTGGSDVETGGRSRSSDV